MIATNTFAPTTGIQSTQLSAGALSNQVGTINTLRHAPVANDSAANAPMEYFTVSDWENQLDMMNNPTAVDLQNHLARVPASEESNPTVAWLREHIQTLLN